MDSYYYFTFVSTYQAIKAEKVLAGEKWTFKMVPVPRIISSSCGTALRCTVHDAGEIRICLELAGVLIEGGYSVPQGNGKKPLSRSK